MVDANKSFEVSEDGITFDKGVHISSGAGAPVHTAPEGSFYWREGTTEVYQNQDGAVDWQLFVPGGVGASATYAHLFQSNDTGVVLDVITKDVWVKWITSVLGPISGDITASTANDNITVQTGGDGNYEIQYSATIQSQTNNNIQAGVFLNDTLVSRTKAEIDIDNASSVYTVNFSCLCPLVDTDVVDLRFRNTSANNDITIFNVCLYATKQESGTAGPQGVAGPAGGNNIDGGDASTVYPAIDTDGGGA